MLGGGEDRHDEDTPKGGEPFEQAAEVVAGGGEDGVGVVAVGSGEVVSAHAVLGLGVANDRFDRGAATQSRLMVSVTRRLWPEI